MIMLFFAFDKAEEMFPLVFLFSILEILWSSPLAELFGPLTGE
jgi:hypothetical protein